MCKKVQKYEYFIPSYTYCSLSQDRQTSASAPTLSAT